MRAHSLQWLPNFLALLLGVVHGSSTPASECNAQAWVRAPDLAPNTIVRGDIRVKTSAVCPTLESALVGLRFKERLYVQTRCSGEIDPIVSAAQWEFQQKEVTVFESTQDLDMGEQHSEAASDVVQPFAILVPSTNFPPALDYDRFVWIARLNGTVGAESMYEYFVRITFVNGTTREISAGFTSFQPVYDLANIPGAPESVSIELKRKGPRKESLQEDSHVAKYTAEVSAVNGLTFTQGSRDVNISVVITRTGPARSFTEPLHVNLCLDARFTPKGVVALDTPIKNPRYVLRATTEDQKHKQSQRYWLNHPSCFGGARGVPATMPNATASQIQATDIITTTSTSVHIPIQIDRRQVTNFDAYYQTLSNALHVTLDVPLPQNDDVDPDDPLDVRVPKQPMSKSPQFDDDEEAWVPWEKKPAQRHPRRPAWRTYTGDATVRVLPVDGFARDQFCQSPLSDQVVLSDSPDCQPPPPVHFLAEGARAPIFVDSDAIQELQRMAPLHRSLLAPPLQPTEESSIEGGGLAHGHYQGAGGGRPLIYVGETWLKKVQRDEEGYTVTVPQPACPDTDTFLGKRWPHSRQICPVH